MIAITREPVSQRVVLTAEGELNDEAVAGLLNALSLTLDETPIVIDLTQAGAMTADNDLGLLSTLAFRSGPVAFRGAHRNHRRLVAVVEC